MATSYQQAFKFLDDALHADDDNEPRAQSNALIGIGYARGWWHRVWRPEIRAEYGSVFGYWAARAVKLVAFLFVFLPIVAIPAFLMSVLDQILGLLLLPVRAVQWVAARLRRAPG